MLCHVTVILMLALRVVIIGDWWWGSLGLLSCYKELFHILIDHIGTRNIFFRQEPDISVKTDGIVVVVMIQYDFGIRQLLCERS